VARAVRRALVLAARGAATTAPNPRVGAVVLAADGRALGEGWHERAGGPHAEVVALAAAGEAARGATLVVTLEPCAHTGRTPPCVDAVVAAGIRRVVACHRDPDPRTAGAGFARLAAAGVEVVTPVEVASAIEINLPFLVRHVLGRPAVTLKWAASLDGKIATASGESRWISGPAARRRALELREEHDAILVGSGTALADDPRLTRRLGRASGPILRIVLDRRLRLPPSARLLREPGPALVYTESGDAARAATLAAEGAEVVRLAAVEPVEVLADLARRGVQSVLVEGGAEVAASFLAAERWDRVVAFVAPRLLGGAGAPSPLGGVGRERLAAAGALARLSVRRRGADLEITGIRERCLRELSSSVAG
jgi:diaminohydroxyphosphoribosylaminopyrimidine deaminase/5-amino-6-(5-phosphoribosylamino)uracil reductase